MAYSADPKPGELTALTSLATDDVFVVGDTSDASEVAKGITKANLITDLSTSFATAGHNHTGVYAPVLGADDNYVTDAEKTAIGTISSKGDVFKVGTPVNNQIGVWTGDGTIEGDAALTFNTTTDVLSTVGLNLSGLTASQIVATDGSKNLQSLAVATYPSLTELTYVKGVTSAIQTQITAKPTISSGAGAPASTPTKVGDTYIDTTNDDAYTAVGTASSADWEKHNDGAGGGSPAGTSTYLQYNNAGSFGATEQTNDGVRWINDAGDYTLLVGKTSASNAKFEVHNEVSGSTRGNVRIISNSTSGADYDIRIDSPDPDIEFMSSDAGLTVPQGYFEIGVPSGGNDLFGISGRNAGDTSFDAPSISIWRKASGGKVGIGTEYDTPTFKFTVAGAAGPQTNDAGALGSGTYSWSDLYLASGGVLNFNNGNATITHSTGLLTSNVPLSLGTSNALTAGSIEIGHASDTTLSRVSAGVVAVEGVTVPTISSTNTLTNKRRTRRLSTTNAPGATPTTNTDNVDVMNFTGLGTAITSMTTNLSGTPVDGDLLEFRFTDDGTARAITWGASFAATTVALPTTTVISTMLRVGFEYSGSTWKCIATA